MINKLFFILFIFSFAINAASFKAEVLCDPVSEMNSLILSKDVIVQRAYHNIEGKPVQCLRFILSPDSSQTSLFARIRVDDFVKKNVKFICAVAPALDSTNKSVYCKIVSNGSILFSKEINNNKINYICDSLNMDNSGGAELSFELAFIKKSIPVDIILPAVLELHECNAGTNISDITISGNSWRFSKKEDEESLDGIYFAPKINFEKIISKSIFPQAGTPVKIIAVIKNSGWGDYHSSSGNTVFVSIDRKNCEIDKVNFNKTIPDIPAGEYNEIEWTVHPHKRATVVKGIVFSEYLNISNEFKIPIYAEKKYTSKLDSENVWERMVNKENNFIAFDWRKNGVRIRFVQSLKGLENIQLAVKNRNMYETISVANLFAGIDILLPDGKIKKLVFKPRSVKYYKTPTEKVVVRGWCFSKETGGVVIEQEYKRSNKLSQIYIETKITTKRKLNIARFYNPDFQINLDEKSVFVTPGYVFNNSLAGISDFKSKWIINNFSLSFYKLNKQLIPFTYINNKFGAICFERIKSIFNNDNLAWVSENSGGRFLLSEIAIPKSGDYLKSIYPNKPFVVKTVIKILPENAKLENALPDVMQIGVVPTPLISAEYKRLFDKIMKAIENADVHSDEELTAMFVLAMQSKKDFNRSDFIFKINKSYSFLYNKISTNGFIPLNSVCSYLYKIDFPQKQNNNAGKISLQLCTKYDWILDNKITYDKFIEKVNINILADDILILVNLADDYNDKEALKFSEKLLAKIRGKSFFNSQKNSLLLFAKLAKANIQLYEITKKQDCLNEAKRLLKISEVFMKKSTENITRDIGMAANHLGVLTPRNPRAGWLSPDATLAFADALFEFAKISSIDSSRSKRLANLLVDSVEKFYMKECDDALLPEYWSSEFQVSAGEKKLPVYLWKMILKQHSQK